MWGGKERGRESKREFGEAKKGKGIQFGQAKRGKGIQKEAEDDWSCVLLRTRLFSIVGLDIWMARSKVESEPLTKS